MFFYSYFDSSQFPNHLASLRSLDKVTKKDLNPIKPTTDTPFYSWFGCPGVTANKTAFYSESSFKTGYEHVSDLLDSQIRNKIDTAV